ncbi:PREDICTED: transcriptional regulator STERILE APETALA [Populus euphratica]|uniref:Transcriptional regulator STERILE APETALA n=1 Tax=Populus euphratica TaxID=75702 RepID=A0AAJ6TH77_POPEU|nr:PREDICTED: transcriptional regulator STERILE APETALA [Populus euphratica]
MSSSSSSSSSGNGNGSGGGNYGARRAGEYEGPSRSRPRAINEVWPEPFLEALAAQVAIDASRLVGRLVAAQALANVFQVCSTWRAVSRSDPLWHRLTRDIWGRTNLLHDTWREEYIYRHQTAQNFLSGRAVHFALHFDPADVDDPNDPDALICRCLALSDRYLACGFADGAVRLFDLTTRLHARTFRPEHHDRLGRFSRAVSGIVITATRLVFATLDGDIHVAVLNSNANLRRARLGQVLNDGALVDFTGRGRWWVGLYAGLPGQAFRVWDGNTEESLFEGGSLTDPEAVMAWHTLTEVTEFVGRVRITSQESVVACTSSRLVIFDLGDLGAVPREEDYTNRRGILVGSFDVCNEAYVIVDGRGNASVRRADTSEEMCGFTVRPPRGVLGCMNGGYVLTCAGGVIRVWQIEQPGHQEYLYSFGERIGEVNALVADERHVAAASSDTNIHLWDFGAQ